MMYVFMHMYAFEWVCKCMCMHMCGFMHVHKNASGVQNTNFKKKALEYCQLQRFLVPENASQQEGKKEKVKMKALGREEEAQSRPFVKVSCAKVNSPLHKRQENSHLWAKAGGPGSRGGRKKEVLGVLPAVQSY